MIYAVLAVVIIVAAAAGAMVAFSPEDGDSYRSTNTDGRLAILGNADENDYLDEDDIAKIKEMIEAGTYSQMADANNDSALDQKDIDMVQSILDAKKYNQNREGSEKRSVSLKYISADNEILDAKYPVLKMAVGGSQRIMALATSIGASDVIVAVNDYVLAYWDDNLWKPYEGLPSIGEKKTPDLETVLKMDIDTVYANGKSSSVTNASDNMIGDKQVLRMITYEDGKLTNGALMLGFMTDYDSGAEEFVKWYDGIFTEIDEKLAAIDDPSATRFYSGTPTYMYAQKDGFSTAMTNSGATNIANIIVTSPTAYGLSVSKCLEDILRENPQYIIAGKYMYTQNTADEVKGVYSGLDYSSFSSTDAYKNGQIYMISYDLPFCIETYIACSIFYPDAFSEQNLKDMLNEYLDKFCYTNGYELDLIHFVVTPDDF